MAAKRIVVGIGGTLGSDAALALAIDLASTLGAEIVGVHVAKPFARSAFPDPPVHDPSRSPSWRSRAAEAFFGALSTSEVEHRMITVEGHPAREILRVADDEDAAFVVVGNGLHSTMPETFLSSVAHELTHDARRPLIIVPERAPAIVDALDRGLGIGVADTRAAHDHVVTGVVATSLRH